MKLGVNESVPKGGTTLPSDNFALDSTPVIKGLGDKDDRQRDLF